MFLNLRNLPNFKNNVLNFKNNVPNFKNNVTERNLIYKYTRFNTKTIKFRHRYKLKFDFSRHIRAAD